MVQGYSGNSCDVAMTFTLSAFSSPFSIMVWKMGSDMPPACALPFCTFMATASWLPTKCSL